MTWDMFLRWASHKNQEAKIQKLVADASKRRKTVADASERRKTVADASKRRNCRPLGLRVKNGDIKNTGHHGLCRFKKSSFSSWLNVCGPMAPPPYWKVQWSL